MFLFFGLLMAAWIISLIAMRFYELDKDRMVEIQNALEDRREEVQREQEELNK